MTLPSNQPVNIDDFTVQEVRRAIEHRAIWMYLLLDEARARGLDWDDFARAAIRRTGSYHGAQMAAKAAEAADLCQFEEVFAPGATRKVFDMEVIEQNAQVFSLRFHYCPLVAAWRKIGASEDDIRQLCDIAMEGDRAIAAAYPHLGFHLGATIAQGHPHCEVCFTQDLS